MIKLKQFLVSAIIVCGCGFLANLNISTLAMDNQVPKKVPADESSSLAPINESVSQVPANENSSTVSATQSTADECVISSNCDSFKNLDKSAYAKNNSNNNNINNTANQGIKYDKNFFKNRITVRYNGDDNNNINSIINSMNSINNINSIDSINSINSINSIDSINNIINKNDKTKQLDPYKKQEAQKNKKIFYEMLFFGGCEERFGDYSKDEHLKDMEITVYPLKSKYGKRIGEYRFSSAYLYRGYCDTEKRDYIGLCIPYDLPEGFYNFKFTYGDICFTEFFGIFITKYKKYDIVYTKM